jgi:dihydropyrimidinase
MSPAARVDTLVVSDKIVTATEVFEGALAIKDGRIAGLGPVDVLPDAAKTIDARGKIVFPGAIDCHVHLGAEYDDWRGGPEIAALAGLTTILVFTLTEGNETLPQSIKRQKDAHEKTSVLDFGYHFILQNKLSVLEGIPEAISMGVPTFKMFMTYKKRGDRMCSDDFICRALEVIGPHGGLAQFHCENGDVIAYLEDKALAAGKVAPTDFPGTCPPWTEEEAINRVIHMGALTGAPVYVVHLSTQLGLERIKKAQALGQRVWTETCPQYMLLTEREMATWGPLAKIGPPLRPAEGPDRQALWDGVTQGHISSVASDHSPRPKKMKEAGWKNIFVDPEGKVVPFGSPGLETLVPLVYSEGVVKRRLPLTWMARVLGENPARLFGLYPRKGAIRVGADADLTIIDPEPETTIRVADHKGVAGWTLYEGWAERGRPWMTLLRGNVLLRDGKLEQSAGYGRFLARGGPMPPLGGSVC